MSDNSINNINNSSNNDEEQQQQKSSMIASVSTYWITRVYGKLILFGEHCVVYKVLVLVGAVSAY